MPSSATITTFYDFSPNTKARASQVNTNFSVFRGHIIPLDPNTAASATNTYDLGSSEWRWRSVYTKGIDFLSNTSTGNDLKIYGSTAGSSPAVVYSVAGTSTASGTHSFMIGGVERFRIDRYGGYRASFTSTSDGTDPGIGGLVYSVGTNGAYVNSVTSEVIIPGSTITVSTAGGPVLLGLISKDGSTQSSINITSAAIGNVQGYFRLSRDTTTTNVASIFQNFRSFTTSSQNFEAGLPGFFAMDNVTSGTHTYFLKGALVSGGAANGFLINNYRIAAKELL